MDDVAVRLEHVDLLNGLDGLDVELLQGSLELLVVGGGARGRTLHLAAGSALAAIVGRNIDTLVIISFFVNTSRMGGFGSCVCMQFCLFSGYSAVFSVKGRV